MDNQEAIRLIRNLPTMCEFTDAYIQIMMKQIFVRTAGVT